MTKQVSLVLVLLLLLATRVAAATRCADPVNGNDANTGIAGGTLPNLTNCKQSIEAACASLGAGDTLRVTNVFHDPVLFDSTTDMCVPAVAANETITSYGPILYGPDPASDVIGSTWLDGGDCLGQLKGDCATATNAVAIWTNVSGSIYKTSEPQFIHFVYFDDIVGWPDGPGGLIAAACATGTCVDSVTNPSQLPLWQISHSYGANSDVQNGIYPAEWWHTAAGGTSGATPPSCTGHGCVAGTTTFTDSGVTWIFEGPAAGTIGAMVAGSWYWDGQSVYVWTPDGTNPNTHVIDADVKLYPIHVATGTGNNGLAVTHVGWRHFGGGPLYFDTSGSGNCFANMVLAYNRGTQTGESNVDVAQFLNGFRLTGSDSTCNPAMLIEHNWIDFCGDHGGCITIQVGGNSKIRFNNVAHGNHAQINLTQNGTTNPCPNCLISGNYVHDSVRSRNAAVVTDSNSGIYAQYATGLVISNNVVTRILDPACGGAQCMGIALGGGAGNTIVNNTVDSTQQGIEEILATAGLTLSNNICNNPTPELAVGTCIVLQAAADLTAANHNIVPGTNVAYVGGAAQTLAQWQALGFDANGYNASATFWRAAWPFDLATGIGIGTADTSFGNGANIGARTLTSRSPLPMQTQIGQNGY
jgi:parallel beta-helix repeat protein